MSELGAWRPKRMVKKKPRRERKVRAKHIVQARWGALISLLSTDKNCDKIVSTFDGGDQCTRMVFWRAGREVLTIDCTWTVNPVSGNDNLTLIETSNVMIP